jgi:propanol-preferring alcohol dehydrogenase
LKESGARPGQTVAIVGAGGGLGSLAQQYARAMGLRVIAVDSGDEKKKMCLEKLGAESFVDFATSKNVVKDVQAATEDGLGPHAVILVAVNEKPFQQAAEVCLPPPVFFLIKPLTLKQYVRPRGTVVCIGLPAGAYLRAPVFESVIKMVTIKGSYVGNRRDTAEALEFYRRGVISAPFKVVGLSELQMVYDLMHKGAIAGRYVVDTSK